MFALNFDVILSCYYHWVDTTAGGLLVHEGIIRPVVNTSVLTWFNKLNLLLKKIEIVENTKAF